MPLATGAFHNLFESLDGSGFRAELLVDEDDIVLDYPTLFQRVNAYEVQA